MENGHLPMFDIYKDGVKLGAIPLSEKTQALLDEGEWITILYHTPRMLQDQLGTSHGAFAIRKEDDQIVTTSPDKLAEYIRLQAAIGAAKRAADA
jgi:hypothetical protein